MKILFVFIFSCWCAVTNAASPAAATTPDGVGSGSLIQITLSLLLVVGLLVGLSILFKKFGMNRIISNSFPVKVIGAIGIGNNQRIMVIEVNDEWIVLGVTPQQISTITTMPRQESSNGPGNDMGKIKFATWMQSALEKYHAKKP
jgi:flagellar protein FliO/FliZ